VKPGPATAFDVLRAYLEARATFSAHEVPGYAAAFRTGLQRHAATKDERIVSSLSATAEERYLEFLRVYPSIALRVPQTMLASYLRMTPETVSRIRKNLSRR
jgi:hypothetical protein